jgi:hypothetical protein
VDRLLGSAQPPLQDKVLGPNGLLSDSWRNYFSRMPATFDSIPNRLNVAELAGQGGSISATDLAPGTLLEGLYRVTYYAHITRAASTSSSLTLTFTWTEGSVLQTAVGTPIVGNTTATGVSESFMFRMDKGSAVTYATTYVSAGATSMQYSLDVSLEKVYA